ncbi:low affinity immunoglobulin gamma Fc region receptor II-like isoform X2 [Scophthalmus maximus]|uniref:low affinity immunoglobulin gamma Fc region receptor II-like isoform X2 n=1 Tax=Scophthalmus maximus TaxID=52904 RepID=UPI0015E13DA9|nr:low affinity immunoglobulin gamma Fc region receptor II-like isoform X2 [Scophthalmus maximus]
MDVSTLCAVVATLAVLPNRSQFFRHESVSLSCGQQGNSSAWRVMMNTSMKTNQECHTSGAPGNESHCFIDCIYPFDTGVYWCESGAGACSNAVNISVTDGTVILDVPVRPVTEGDDVTLRCKNWTTPSSGLASRFYKDQLFIGSSSTGSMTIAGVSEADQGLYKCSISGAGESTHSWLAVTGHREPPNFRLLALILLPVVGACLSLALVTLLGLRSRCKGKSDLDVSYTDVTIAQEVQPQRIRDADTTQTFYSTLNLEAT